MTFKRSDIDLIHGTLFVIFTESLYENLPSCILIEITFFGSADNGFLLPFADVSQRNG